MSFARPPVGVPGKLLVGNALDVAVSMPRTGNAADRGEVGLRARFAESGSLREMLIAIATSDADGEALGYDIIRDAEEVKRRTGYMTQKFSLYDELTIAENLQFSAGVHGLDRPKARVDQALERWPILSDYTNAQLYSKSKALRIKMNFKQPVGGGAGGGGGALISKVLRLSTTRPKRYCSSLGSRASRPADCSSRLQHLAPSFSFHLA